MRVFVILGLMLAGFFAVRAWVRRMTQLFSRRDPNAWPPSGPDEQLPSLSDLDAELSGKDLPSRPQTPHQSAPEPIPRGSGARVLVVDDSDTVQQMARMLLEPEGLVVIPARDTRAAIEALERDSPAVLLIDAGMPGQSRPTAAAELLEHPLCQGRPVLLLRGEGAGVDPSIAERAGVAGSVPKPFDSQALLDQVSRALSQAASQPVCPVCDHAVEQSWTTCSVCGAVHHPECWQLNDGCGRCKPVG